MSQDGRGARLASRDFGLYLHPGSPASLLPYDLLVIIFLLCRHENTPRNSGEPVRSEITLSHVSRHWRSAAVTTPLLWTNIRRRFPGSIALLSVYLERSQPAPFDLFAEIGYEEQCRRAPRPASSSNNGDMSNIDAGQCDSPLCNILKPHFSRCQDLHITIANPSGQLLAQQCIFTAFRTPILNPLHIFMRKHSAERLGDLSIFVNSGGQLSHVSKWSHICISIFPSANLPAPSSCPYCSEDCRASLPTEAGMVVRA